MSKRQLTQAEHLFRTLLKELRQEKGLTQTQLGERLGLPQSYVSKYEAGERRLDFVETWCVCEALGVGIEDFAKAFSAGLSRTGAKKRG